MKFLMVIFVIIKLFTMSLHIHSTNNNNIVPDTSICYSDSPYFIIIRKVSWDKIFAVFTVLGTCVCRLGIMKILP